MTQLAHTPVTAFADDFRKAGFGVIRHAVPLDVAESLKLRLQQLLPPTAERPLQRLVPRIVEHDSRIADLLTSGPLVATLTAIFGVTPQLICSYGHEKPAHTGAHTGPHSDVAHLPGVPHHQSLLMVKVMVALTPIRHGSGGTTIFPASHRWPAASAPSTESEGRQALLDPGDMVLFHANAWHTATPNSSAQPRLSLWFVFAQLWMRVFQGYEFSPAFIDELGPRLASEPQLKSVFGLNDPYATVS